LELVAVVSKLSFHSTECHRYIQFSYECTVNIKILTHAAAYMIQGYY